MSTLKKLEEAQKKAVAIRPKVGGFPYLAQVLKQAGVTKNSWTLPACQSVYGMEGNYIVQQGKPLIEGMADIPVFNQEALIRAIRTDQAGQSTFPEFLQATWEAGVVHYDVDFIARTVCYYGILGELYKEEYPEVGV